MAVHLLESESAGAVSLGPSRPLLSSGPCSAVPAGSRQPSVPPPRRLLPPGYFSLCCWVLRGPDPATCCCSRPPCLTRSFPGGAGSRGSSSGSLWNRVWRSGGFWASADWPHQALRVGSAQCSAGKGGLHRQSARCLVRSRCLPEPHREIVAEPVLQTVS